MNRMVTPTGQRKSRHCNGLKCLTPARTGTGICGVPLRMSNRFAPARAA